MHEVNLLAVLVAGIVPMIVGFLWYGQLFGKRWLELMETTAEEIQKKLQSLEDSRGQLPAGAGHRLHPGPAFRRDGRTRERLFDVRQQRQRHGGRPPGADGPDRFRSPGRLSGGGLRGPQGRTLLAHPWP